MTAIRQHNPPHPGTILKEDYLDLLEITISSAATGLGIARKNLSAIVNAKAGISPEMAFCLAEAFDTTPDFWLSLQMNYDLWHIRITRSATSVEKFYQHKNGVRKKKKVESVHQTSFYFQISSGRRLSQVQKTDS